jgi:hypothetical protein
MVQRERRQRWRCEHAAAGDVRRVGVVVDGDGSGAGNGAMARVGGR